MALLYLDLLSRWKWALLVVAAMAALFAYPLTIDPNAIFLVQPESGGGVNELILAGLWGSLLLSIDTARGVPRVWATLPLRSDQVALVVWAFSVFACPVVATGAFAAEGLLVWFASGEASTLALVPLALLNTVAYAGFAHLMFCEFRTRSSHRWRRELGRSAYFAVLGGSYFFISLFPGRWTVPTPLPFIVLGVGLAAAAWSLVRTRIFLRSQRADRKLPAGSASLPLAKLREPGRLMVQKAPYPAAEGARLGVLASMFILLPVTVLVAAVGLKPERLGGAGLVGGWTAAEAGYSLMICLVFGSLFIVFLAAHPWLNALRALRALPFGAHRVALACLKPAAAAYAGVIGVLIVPMAMLLGAELRGVIWAVVLIVPAATALSLAAFLRWGYAVVMAAVFGLIPASVLVRRVDPRYLADPPLLAGSVLALLMIGGGYLIFVIVLRRSPSAYRAKNVPWF